MRVKIGKQRATLQEKKSEADQLRNCKEEIHFLCNENLRLKMELLEARAFNMTEKYELAWGWIGPPDIPMARPWEKILDEVQDRAEEEKNKGVKYAT